MWTTSKCGRRTQYGRRQILEQLFGSDDGGKCRTILSLKNFINYYLYKFIE